MKNILVISHLKKDSQADLVMEHLRRRGARATQICTDAGHWRVGLVESRRGIRVSTYGGKTWRPDAVWYATHPRCDSLPAACHEFPGEHRSSVSQMLRDIHHAFEGEVAWVPGSMASIERADSKPAMFRIARNVGLTVPRETLDGPRRVAESRWGASRPYRKKLGFPCVTTFVRGQGVEMNSTVPNTLGYAASSSTVWQWQTPVASVAHIRCCVVGDRVWAVRWDRESPLSALCDYRTHAAGEESWTHVDLGSQTEDRLRRLLAQTGLVTACPEFLVTPRGENVLIDLNPTGDWAGFFTRKDRAAIASSIADEILKVRR